jgi:V/A-type H+-transporting ATPase subunit I
LPFVLILVLGHVLNLAMSALGAFVHPLRLSFVEYFKNAGYEGKGTLYKPFKK